MRRTRLVIAAAIFAASTSSVFAHERCGCREGLVLNGRLNTADFDGGVGDRFGSDAGGGGYAIAYGGASAGGASGAFASARASAFASASSHAFSNSGGQGGTHAGGGYGGGHH